jgi:hypothetical protein
VCLSNRVETTIARSPWSVVTARVTRAQAVALNFASTPIIPGCRVLRRLGQDEEPDRTERIPPERQIAPRTWWYTSSTTLGEGDIAPSTVGTTEVDDDAITTPKRVPLSSQGFSYSISGNSRATPTTVTHGLGRIPNATFDSGHNDLATWITNATTTQLTLNGLNVTGSAINGTATLYFW